MPRPSRSGPGGGGMDEPDGHAHVEKDGTNSTKAAKEPIVLA